MLDCRHMDPKGYFFLHFSKLQIFHLIFKAKCQSSKSFSFFLNIKIFKKKNPTSAYFIPTHKSSCYINRSSKISC